MTVACDGQQGCVEYVAEESLADYRRSLSPEQRAGIEAVVMDMWPAYINATHAHVPEAQQKIAFDRFHLLIQIGKAVDTVRKQENRELLARASKGRNTE
jgi:transposase